jgi:hypothetical protein
VAQLGCGVAQIRVPRGSDRVRRGSEGCCVEAIRTTREYSSSSIYKYFMYARIM